MDDMTIRKLCALNNEFYRNNSESFSATRQRAWDGWTRVAHSFSVCMKENRTSCLDLACGNMRFERFMRERFPQCAFEFTCIDSCEDLAQSAHDIRFENVDIIDFLLQARRLPWEDASYDIAVSFGFMHHIPSRRLRASCLDSMVQALRPGGVGALSFWQFAEDVRLAEKATSTTNHGCEELGVSLDAGDYLLGWNDRAHVYRYCHSFSANEIDHFAELISARCEIIDRFSADGRSGALNGYLVFRRLPFGMH